MQKTKMNPTVFDQILGSEVNESAYLESLLIYWRRQSPALYIDHAVQDVSVVELCNVFFEVYGLVVTEVKTA